jgi:hypothetical protein
MNKNYVGLAAVAAEQLRENINKLRLYQRSIFTSYTDSIL